MSIRLLTVVASACPVLLFSVVFAAATVNDSAIIGIEAVREKYEGQHYWLTRYAVSDSNKWPRLSRQSLLPEENCRVVLDKIHWGDRRDMTRASQPVCDSLWLIVQLEPSNSRLKLRAGYACGKVCTLEQVVIILDSLLSKTPEDRGPGRVVGIRQTPVIHFPSDTMEAELQSEERRQFETRLALMHRHPHRDISSELRVLAADSLFEWLYRDQRLRFYAEIEDHRITCVSALRSSFFPRYLFFGLVFDFQLPVEARRWLIVRRWTSLAINETDGRVFILNDKPIGMEPGIPEFSVDIAGLLPQLDLYSLPIDQSKEFLFSELFPYLFFPDNVILLESTKDLCYFDQSMKRDYDYLPVVESDSVIRREHFAPVTGKLATPELYWIWESLFDRWCGEGAADTARQAVQSATPEDPLAIHEMIREQFGRPRVSGKYEVKPFTITKDSSSLSIKGMVWHLSSGALWDWDITVHSDNRVSVYRKLLEEYYGPATGCDDERWKYRALDSQ